VHDAIDVRVGVSRRPLRVHRVFLRMGRRHRAERRWQSERAVPFLDQAPARGYAGAMRVSAEHNVIGVLFPQHLTRVLQPVDLAWARRFKASPSGKFHQLTRDRRFLAYAFLHS
jgi:hypothetical protein